MEPRLPPRARDHGQHNIKHTKRPLPVISACTHGQKGGAPAEHPSCGGAPARHPQAACPWPATAAAHGWGAWLAPRVASRPPRVVPACFLASSRPKLPAAAGRASSPPSPPPAQFLPCQSMYCFPSTQFQSSTAATSGLCQTRTLVQVLAELPPPHSCFSKIKIDQTATQTPQPQSHTHQQAYAVVRPRAAHTQRAQHTATARRGAGQFPRAAHAARSAPRAERTRAERTCP